MTVACPNKNLTEWKELADKYGKNLAESLYYRNGGQIPSVQEAQVLLRGRKSGEFRSIVQNLGTTLSNSQVDLVNTLSGVVNKVGDELYIVKGSRLGEVPAPGAEAEIHGANLRFLNAVNEEFGPLFKITKLGETVKNETLGDEIISDLKSGTFESSYAKTYKDFANDPASRDLVLKELSEQALGSEAARAELERGLGADLVNKIIDYNKATKPTETEPAPSKAFSSPNPETKTLVDKYKTASGIAIPDGQRINKLDLDYSKKIADAYESLKHSPNDSEVLEAYGAMAHESVDQYKVLQDAGYKVELFTGEGEPYKSSEEMIKDVRENKHLYVLSTEKDFGQSKITDQQRTENPLLADSEIKDVNGKPLLMNDVFRAVHDFFGHTDRGNSFGPIGEENAWDVHARMYSDQARRAMTTETRGQNSWVNFGPHARNAEGKLIAKGEQGYLDLVNRPFAEQKIGLLPEEFSQIRQVPEKVASDTYKVEVNQEILDNIASLNADAQKAPVSEQTDVLKTNEKILNNVAAKYSKAYEETQVGTVNHNVLKFLGKKFNIPFEVVNDTTVNWRGKFENGKVYINEAKVNEFTPLHEYLHPYTMALQKDNAELYNNLITELRSTEEGKSAIERAAKEYPELSAKDQLDEALVDHLSRLSGSREIEQRPWYKQFIDWFKRIFSINGVSIADLSLNMSLSDIADKVVDPTYVADLKKYTEFNDAAVKLQKDVTTGKEFTENFVNILNKVKEKLRLDTNIPAKSKDEETRKYFSSRQLADLEINTNVYQALNDYVISSIVNGKKINESFESFRELYESKNGKLSKDEMLKGMSILSDMENHVVLYNESRFVVDAIAKENPEEFEDTFSVLQNRLNGDTQIINNYHNYGLKLMSDWLYPTMERTVAGKIKAGKIEEIPGYEEYKVVKAENPNIAEPEAVERGVKMWLRGQMEHATTDIGFFNSYMSGTLNSSDPISQLTALSLKEEFSKNNDRLFKVKNSINEVVKKVRGTKLLTTNADHKEFYKGFLHQVDNWEKTGYDTDGNPTFDYVKRTAFHEPYRYDQFYKAKRNMFKEIGIRPNKSDEAAYKIWEAKKEAWFDKHTVREFNDAGEVIKTSPSKDYINPEYARVANDSVFKELTRHYTDANNKLGKYQMKYGIVPQQEVSGGLEKGLSAKKGVKGNLEELKNNIKESISSQTGGYYAQDINGKEYRNVPIRYTRMVDEGRLNYNLAKTVSDFWESSSKYSSVKNIEPAVLTLRNFIEGNSFLKINERDAPQVDAKGAKKLGNFVKNITKTKDKTNINRMLVNFINDAMYGEVEQTVDVRSPLGNLKYQVYKKGDTSVNGKPHREYIYSLEDLKKKTGNEDIDYNHFEKGTERDVNGYGVTLIRNDKIVSVNKVANKLNTLTSTISLGGNVIAGVSNWLSDASTAFIEGTGGKYYNLKEWGSAQKEYFKNIANFNILEDTRGGKGSVLGQMLVKYSAIHGEFLNEYGKNIGVGVANKLFRRSSLFFMLHAGEHQSQSVQMIAAMKHVKVEDGAGKKISLYDAYEKGADGYIKLKDGIKWSEKQDLEFKNTLQSVIRDRGNYSDFDKAGLQRLWWGKMIMMFRRHIFNGIKNRWGSEYLDYERGTATQGYYRSFISSLASEVNELRLNGKLRKLTPDEQYYAKKTLADLGQFALLAMVLVPAFRNEDEDKQGWDDFAALFSRRLQQDVSFYINPLEWKKVIQSPVVTGNTVDKFYDFFSQAAIAPSETYERDGAGYAAGDSKLAVKFKKLLPVYRTAINLQDPQDLLKFYDLKVPINTNK